MKSWIILVVRSWKQLAALVEAIAPPVETNFTAEVRLEGVRGIGCSHIRSQRCHICLAKWFNIAAVTVGLRNVPKNTPKYAQIDSYMTSLPQIVETRQRTPVLLQEHDSRRRKHVVRAGLAIAAATVSLERAAAEPRSIYSTLLQSYCTSYQIS